MSVLSFPLYDTVQIFGLRPDIVWILSKYRLDQILSRYRPARFEASFDRYSVAAPPRPRCPSRRKGPRRQGAAHVGGERGQHRRHRHSRQLGRRRVGEGQGNF